MHGGKGVQQKIHHKKERKTIDNTARRYNRRFTREAFTHTHKNTHKGPSIDSNVQSFLKTRNAAEQAMQTESMLEIQ